jgi:hypothetical protein
LRKVPRVSLAILLVGLAALIVAVLALVRGKLDLLWITNRKIAAGVLGAAVVLVVIGSVLASPSSTRQTATGAPPGPIGGVDESGAVSGGSVAPTTANGVPGSAGQKPDGSGASPLACAVLMSNTQPEENHTTEVLVNTAAGATVTATAHFRTTTTSHTDRATATGHTDIPFEVTKGTIGFRVLVDITIKAHGLSRSCATSFTPVK